MAKLSMTHNMYFVQARGEFLFMGTCPGRMNREQALNLAAYLVVNSRLLPGELEFADVLEALLAGLHQ